MLIVVAGASGVIGTRLKQRLRGDGHELRVLVRREPHTPEERRWDPDGGQLGDDVLHEADAVISLGGVGVGDHRWTDDYKRQIVSSRLQPTRTIAETIARLGTNAPKVLISASAVGFYGDTGDRIVDESAPMGAGFLADVCRQWEEATAAAQDGGQTRVVHLRTGLVLSPSGGLLGRLKLLVKLGLGGKLGSGRQYQPWISLDDEVGAIAFLLTAAAVSGPVNLTGPEPVRQEAFIKTLAAQLHRPAIVPAPAFALRLVLGGFADEGVLAGQRALPTVLTEAGYTFAHSRLEDALASVLG